MPKEITLTKEEIKELIREIEKNYMKCELCSIKNIWDPRCFGRSKYCLECGIRFRKKYSGGRERTRELVRIRDKHTCQDCREKWTIGKRRFDVHHLNGLCGKKSKNYDKISNMEGIITLCHKCHFNRPEHTIKRLSTPKNI